jgi:hypothetical protein
MDENAGNEDGWVMARLVALERANRRLWVGLGALAMTLVSVCIAAVFVAASLDLTPRSGAAGRSGSVTADEVTVSGALRVVDESGRNLIWIGRERAAAGASAASGQAVIGLFAGEGAGDDTPQQTVRIATSRAGSALSLSTPEGAQSLSAFAGGTGVSLELRSGNTARVLSERAEGATVAREPAVQEQRKRAEAPAIATAASGQADRGTIVDLSDPAIQQLGGGLYVGQLSLSDQSGVLRVSGRLINASSIDQLRAEFRLSVGGRELPFSVGRIGAGSSTSFTVELPSADAAALRAARLRWVRSTLSYLSE